MRIDDYGITIKRYIVLSLGIWLSVVCVYTIIGKTNIKFIPVSLAIMLMLISFGPWGMFSVSEHYQVKRLKAILEKAAILKDGKIQNESILNMKNNGSLEFKNERLLSDSLHNEVYSILDYMDDFHGFAAIRSWYTQNIDSLVEGKLKSKENNYYNEAEIYMNAMGLEYENRYEAESEYINFNTIGDEKLLNVKGYDYTMSFSDYNYNDDESIVCSFDLDSVSYKVIYNSDEKTPLILEADDQKIELKQQPFNLNFNDMLQRLFNETKSEVNVAPDKMQLKAINKKIEVKYQINSLETKKDGDKYKTRSMSGNIFVRRVE